MFLRIPKDCCKEKNTRQYASGMKKTAISSSLSSINHSFYGNLHVFFHKSFQQLSDSPHPYLPKHLPTWVTVTSRKNSRRHQVRASSRGSLQGVRCTLLIGPAAEISTCFGFERILGVPICNLQLDFIFAILRRLKHITYPIRIIMWHGGTHLYCQTTSQLSFTSMDI